MIKNKFIKRLIEKGVEWMLTLSGAITSIIILFICIFLFIEGFGLFKSPTIEDGYGLYVNSENSINELNPQELKQIFDSEVTNWNELGGKEESIRVFRLDEIFEMYSEEEFGEGYELLPVKLGEVIQKDPSIIAFLPKEYKSGLNLG